MQYWKANRLVVLTALLLLLAACSGTSTEQSAADPGTQSASAGMQENANNDAPALKTRPAEAAQTATPAVLPQGTTLRVRLDSSVGSKISRAGDTFSASLLEPVTAHGKVVIPKSAQAAGVVSNAKSLGRFSGEAILSLKLNSITIAGHDYQLETASYTQVKKGKGKRTAVAVGGGAGLGALVGGLVGGGKGAAIGAATGAGAGTAGAAMTGNQEIVLPAETAISFRLSQPLQIQ
jgi:hypothetical protein